jgi:DNA repair photolyase
MDKPLNQPNTPIHGRGASNNPSNRFEPIHLERDEEWNPEEDLPRGTLLFKDNSASIVNFNDSPDVGFEASLNPYRGCEHGCIYCYARPTHEYLGFSAGLDFESRIMVKEKAPELLRKELSSPKWKPQVIVMSGVTDCYQPIERKLKLTRRCLEVLAEFRNPVAIITKNALVTRDIDIFQSMTRFNGAAVNISITTLDSTLTPKLEPRAPLPKARLKAIEELRQAGVPVGVMVAPVIPGLTDHEMSAILKAAASAGAQWAGYVALRLPFAVKELFQTWLDQHFPGRKEKVLSGIRAIRGGKLNDPNYGTRMRGEGVFAEQLEAWFALSCRRAGLTGPRPSLSTASFSSLASDRKQKTFPF